MKLKDRPINNTSPATDVAPLFHTSQPNMVGSSLSFAERSGEMVYGREPVQHKAGVAMLLLPVQPMMTVLCAHSSSKYCALAFPLFPHLVLYFPLRLVPWLSDTLRSIECVGN